jgi:hypothetical protein
MSLGRGRQTSGVATGEEREGANSRPSEHMSRWRGVCPNFLWTPHSTGGWGVCRERGLMACSLCWNAMPHGEWCRACGEGLTESELDAGDVQPLTGLRLAVRIAKGGPLSPDDEATVRAYYAGLRERSGRGRSTP